MASFLLGGLLTVLHAVPALASMEFAPSSVAKGVLLVASPSLEDPNFRQAVVLVVEHGPEGTLGLILNRSTNVLLSHALPDLTVLKGTTYRLFAGGPVEPTRLLLLFRLKEPPADARSVYDGVHLGRTPKALERIITQAKPTETFRAFAGFAAWAPRQLEAEMLMGAWAVLPPDSVGIFDQDPAVLWSDCISRLRAPRVIGAVWSIPRARCPRTEDQLDCQTKGRARSIRAVRDRSKTTPVKEVRASLDGTYRSVLAERAALDGWEGSSQTVLLARRTRTIGMCSFDARSEGQSGDSLEGKVREIRRVRLG